MANDYPHFHNTTRLRGVALQTAIRYNESLYNILRQFYFDNSSRWYSPHEAMDELRPIGVMHDINTFRSQITKLEKDGDLIKSEEAEAVTPSNQKCHRWRWNVKGQQQVF